MCACEFVRGNQARGTVDLSVGRHLAAYQTNHHAGAVIIVDPQWVREREGQNITTKTVVSAFTKHDFICKLYLYK